MDKLEEEALLSCNADCLLINFVCGRRDQLDQQLTSVCPLPVSMLANPLSLMSDRLKISPLVLKHNHEKRIMRMYVNTLVSIKCSLKGNCIENQSGEFVW